MVVKVQRQVECLFQVFFYHFSVCHANGMAMNVPMISKKGKNIKEKTIVTKLQTKLNNSYYRIKYI